MSDILDRIETNDQDTTIDMSELTQAMDRGFFDGLSESERTQFNLFLQDIHTITQPLTQSFFKTLSEGFLQQQPILEQRNKKHPQQKVQMYIPKGPQGPRISDGNNQQFTPVMDIQPSTGGMYQTLPKHIQKAQSLVHLYLRINDLTNNYLEKNLQKVKNQLKHKDVEYKKRDEGEVGSQKWIQKKVDDFKNTRIFKFGTYKEKKQYSLKVTEGLEKDGSLDEKTKENLKVAYLVALYRNDSGELSLYGIKDRAEKQKPLYKTYREKLNTDQESYRKHRKKEREHEVRGFGYVETENPFMEQESQLHAIQDYLDTILAMPDSQNSDSWGGHFIAGWEAPIPFLPGIKEVNRLLNFSTVGTKKSAGRKLTGIEELFFDSFTKLGKANEEVGKMEITSYDVGKSVSGTLRFAIELGLTGGMMGLGSKVVMKGLKKTAEKGLKKVVKEGIKKKATKQAIKEIGKEAIKKGVLMTMTNQSHNTMINIMNEMITKYKLKVDSEGNIIVSEGEPGAHIVKGLIKGVAKSVVSNSAEQIGGPLVDGLFSLLPKKVITTLLTNTLNYGNVDDFLIQQAGKGTLTGDSLESFLQNSLQSGFVGESLEEFISQGISGVHDYLRGDMTMDEIYTLYGSKVTVLTTLLMSGGMQVTKIGAGKIRYTDGGKEKVLDIKKIDQENIDNMGNETTLDTDLSTTSSMKKALDAIPEKHNETKKLLENHAMNAEGETKKTIFRIATLLSTKFSSPKATDSQSQRIKDIHALLSGETPDWKQLNSLSTLYRVAELVEGVDGVSEVTQEQSWNDRLNTGDTKVAEEFDASRKEFEKNKELRNETSSYEGRTQRLQKASECLAFFGHEVTFTPEQQRAIIWAHIQPSDTETFRILTEAGFPRDQAQILMDNGVCGLIGNVLNIVGFGKKKTLKTIDKKLLDSGISSSFSSLGYADRILLHSKLGQGKLIYSGENGFNLSNRTGVNTGEMLSGELILRGDLVSFSPGGGGYDIPLFSIKDASLTLNYITKNEALEQKLIEEEIKGKIRVKKKGTLDTDQTESDFEIHTNPDALFDENGSGDIPDAPHVFNAKGFTYLDQNNELVELSNQTVLACHGMVITDINSGKKRRVLERKRTSDGGYIDISTVIKKAESELGYTIDALFICSYGGVIELGKEFENKILIMGDLALGDINKDKYGDIYIERLRGKNKENNYRKYSFPDVTLDEARETSSTVSPNGVIPSLDSDFSFIVPPLRESVKYLSQDLNIVTYTSGYDGGGGIGINGKYLSVENRKALNYLVEHGHSDFTVTYAKNSGRGNDQSKFPDEVYHISFGASTTYELADRAKLFVDQMVFQEAMKITAIQATNEGITDYLNEKYNEPVIDESSLYKLACDFTINDGILVPSSSHDINTTYYELVDIMDLSQE